ncbi:ATP-binding protein [Kitasatospora sp. NPDC101157]|uniref:ATP-binding protein n=1 Tax=Kitasatospora sp. NPDC101157 TaxID=3364098 RepID=UPI00382F328C
MSTADLRFSARLAQVGAVRRWVKEALRELGLHLDDPLVGDVQLVVSELGANAVVHGCGGERSDVELTASLQYIRSGVLRMSVTDPGLGKPKPRRAEQDAPSGRGLQPEGVVTQIRLKPVVDVGREFQVAPGRVVIMPLELDGPVAPPVRVCSGTPVRRDGQSPPADPTPVAPPLTNGGRGPVLVTVPAVSAVQLQAGSRDHCLGLRFVHGLPIDELRPEAATEIVVVGDVMRRVQPAGRHGVGRRTVKRAGNVAPVPFRPDACEDFPIRSGDEPPCHGQRVPVTVQDNPSSGENTRRDHSQPSQ